MIPWIQFPTILPVIGGGAEQHTLMSDILFLSVKEHASKLRTDEGFLSAAGDLATLTATGGKDMYIARAKVVFFRNTTSLVSTADEVVLKVNGTVVETAKFSGSAEQPTWEYTFKNIGHKVAATQIIKLEVITLDTQVDVEGFIECFEETTGESPYQATEFA